MLASYDEFGRYGVVLRDFSAEGGEVFRQEENTGWRLAEVAVNDEQASEMSCHDNTPEGFFPLAGETLLTLSLDDHFACCHTFLLDRPVLICSGVWHALAAPKGPARVLVMENRDVNLEKKTLPK